MLPAQRRQQILEDIRRNGVGLIVNLSQKYGVSEMTIRRDLTTLEKEGYVKRTHGGAIPSNASDVEPRYVLKQKVCASQKACIAAYAAQNFVKDGEVIILEGGTTVTCMVNYLAGIQDLTVVTNGLQTSNELQSLLPHTTVICTGGILREISSTFVGPVAERFFKEFHANKMFLSTTGLTLDAGLSDPNMLEIQVQKAMIAAAEEVVLLIDSSKFGVKSLMTVMGIDEVKTLITDDKAPSDMVHTLRERGIDVHIVCNDS
jgi:DeoR/GlpR family transcriptional regulator of sugar metabolism